jgi:hypothetical protein
MKWEGGFPVSVPPEAESRDRTKDEAGRGAWAASGRWRCSRFRQERTGWRSPPLVVGRLWSGAVRVLTGSLNLTRN